MLPIYLLVQPVQPRKPKKNISQRSAPKNGCPSKMMSLKPSGFLQQWNHHQGRFRGAGSLITKTRTNSSHELATDFHHLRCQNSVPPTSKEFLQFLFLTQNYTSIGPQTVETQVPPKPVLFVLRRKPPTKKRKNWFLGEKKTTHLNLLSFFLCFLRAGPSVSSPQNSLSPPSSSAQIVVVWAATRWDSPHGQRSPCRLCCHFCLPNGESSYAPRSPKTSDDFFWPGDFLLVRCFGEFLVILLVLWRVVDVPIVDWMGKKMMIFFQIFCLEFV